MYRKYFTFATKNNEKTFFYIMATTNNNTQSTKKGRWFRFLIPSLVGILIGLGGYIFYISKAHSYLSDDPKACVNCHIMEPEYATWMHSSHGRNTVCNDCHVLTTTFFANTISKRTTVCATPRCSLSAWNLK